MPADIVISFSELDTGRQCPHKHTLAYVERWQSQKPDTSALGRGTMWHTVMADHYTALKEDRDPLAAVDETFKNFYRTHRDHDTIELLRWMYEGYVQQYKLDENWQIVAVEHKAIVPLLTPSGRRSRFKLKIIVDLVVRDRTTGRVWLIDHKSCANLPKEQEWELADQFGLYTWGLRQLGHKPFGCIHNGARTTRNKGDYPNAVEEWELQKAAGLKAGVKPKRQTLDERFSRFFMTRTDQELDTIAQDALDMARNLYDRRFAKPRSTDPDRCRWRCDYTEACLIGRKLGPQRERQFLRDIGFEQNFTRH